MSSGNKTERKGPGMGSGLGVMGGGITFLAGNPGEKCNANYRVGVRAGGRG